MTPPIPAAVLAGLADWLERHDFATLAEALDDLYRRLPGFPPIPRSER